MRFWECCKLVLVVAAWFITGAILLFTNKILLTNGIRAPVSITMLHMTASCLFANSAVLFGGFAAQSFKSNRQRLNVFVLASAFGCSVVAGVSSFAFIPVSFYEMISSTTPLFTAFFAYLMVGEVGGNWLSYVSLVCIALGAALATGGEPMWHALGFFLALLSTVLRAFKAVLQQRLLQNEEEQLDSINLLRHMTLNVIGLLLPVAAITEGPMAVLGPLGLAVKSGELSLLGVMLLNVSAAFVVNWIQMTVTKMIGATVLQVLGIFKGSATAILSILFFGNPVTFSSILGYTCVITSVGVYNLSRSDFCAGLRNDGNAAGQLAAEYRTVPNQLPGYHVRTLPADNIGVKEDEQTSPRGRGVSLPTQRAQKSDSPT